MARSPHPPQGLFTAILTRLRLLLQILEHCHLRFIPDHVILWLLRLYQTQLSCCAHRTLHHGASCSQFFAIRIQQVGVVQAIPHQIQRFYDCKQALQILKGQQNQRLSANFTNVSSTHTNTYRHKKRNGPCDESPGCDWISWCDCSPFLDCDLALPDCDLGLCDMDTCDAGVCETCSVLPCEPGGCS